MAKADSFRINHLGLVRVRVQGIGLLRTYVLSYNSARFNALRPIVLEASPSRVPTTLANFSQQKMQIQIKTTDFGEYLNFGIIAPFIKLTANSYAQI